MSIADAYPNPGEPGEPEFVLDPVEYLALTELISYFHVLHEAGLARNDREGNDAVEIGEASDHMELRKFVVHYNSEDEKVPSPYDQMRWTPIDKKTTTFSEILARIPRVEVLGADFRPPEDRLHWNDVFLEIDGVRYLLNGDGITAYADSEGIDDKGKESADSGDFFTVEVFAWAAPPVLPTELQAMLKAARMRRQTNEP